MSFLAFATASLIAMAPAMKPLGHATGPSSPVANSGRQPTRFIGAVPDTGQFLPDSTVLARVEDRVITIRDFRTAYYNAGIARPGRDSVSRAEFLGNMVHKEIMAFTALGIDRPLAFEDRLTLRAHQRVLLQNVLYKRRVTDSISVTEREIRDAYRHYTYDQHLRDILFDDRATAQQVRNQLLRGRITWNDAVRTYSRADHPGADGDRGWVSRNDLGSFALKVFDLEPGAISQVVQDVGGYRVVQSLGRRPASPPDYDAVRWYLAYDIRAEKSAPRAQEITRQVRARAGVTYDTTNIRWAAARFREALTFGGGTGPDGGPRPAIGPADTGRVLARTANRRFTLSQFMVGYEATPSLLRRPVISLEPFLFTLDGMFLEPERAEYALALGLDQDSLTLALMERKREEILVEHLYQDSILSRVVVTPAMRRQYYDEHRERLVWPPRVRYAYFVRPSEAAAGSLLTRLRSGEDAQAIWESEAAHGHPEGVIREVEPDQAGQYRELLFEELRPGQATMIGPDPAGNHAVFQSLGYEPPRPMSYEEAERVVDDSVQGAVAERLLQEFLARHRRRFRIDSHPELVMRIALTDPSDDLALAPEEP